MASGGPPCSNFLHHISQETQRFIYLTWIRNLLNKFYKINFHLPNKLFYHCHLKHILFVFGCKFRRHFIDPCSKSSGAFRRRFGLMVFLSLNVPDIEGEMMCHGLVSCQYRLTLFLSTKKVMLYNVYVCVLCVFDIRYWGMWSYMFVSHSLVDEKRGIPAVIHNHSG